jgi:hypothetical protein
LIHREVTYAKASGQGKAECELEGQEHELRRSPLHEN